MRIWRLAIYIMVTTLGLGAGTVRGESPHPFVPADFDVPAVHETADYRLRTLRKAEIYHFPLDEAAGACLAKNFDDMAAIQRYSGTDITINDRAIPIVRCAEGIVWFEFEDLCDSPRSKDDYIEIACLFHTVILANIPTMSDRENDQARRFVNLIDEFYDRNVKLVASAATAPEDLYEGERLAFEFKRTASRLREMQAIEYLGLKHLA